MTQWGENNDPANQDDYPDTHVNGSQDLSNADAAKFNADEQELAVNERQSVESNTDKFIDVDSAEEANADNSIGEELGGTTNLSLDQLKREGDLQGNDEE